MKNSSGALLRKVIKTTMFALACGVMSTAHAWPDRAIKMIVPFPAGGINDTVARLTATYLGEELKTSVIVENRAGAGGTIGTMSAVNSQADGYTLLLGATSTIAVAPHLYKNVGYSPSKDLVALGGIASAPSIAVTAADSPWSDLGALVAADKKDPAAINYGSAGAGTSHHIQTELLKLRTGSQWMHVPYRGGAPAMTDLMGKQIDLLLEPLPTALPFVQSGRVKALGVTTLQRSAVLPDVKTFHEQGITDYEATLWFGLFAPVGVPAEVSSKVSDALRRVFARPDVKQDLRQRGIDAYPDGPKQFADFVEAEIKLWGDVITKAKISVN
ncbi:tripartite tricarboxylate transporter substrate binding protein [Candidimonas sp. SYP-B2681]|uniref:Bug family tripartite tricarboxylate transporter substrate binding protein n=1 Tax=Candidimonas sp. SYP-B2681 TaxID=2497686 RepID=UPI00131583B1|nr:tripartite tricarboxylate transporter substrate binding protein [Candidimonas sp. SYP-B2681]